MMSLETLWQDIRFGMRTLAKSPMMAAVVILSLALGIGANTAIFSVLNAALLRTLPVSNPDRLVLLEWHAKDWPRAIVSSVEGNGGRDAGGLMSSYSQSSQLFEYVRDHNHVFDATVAFSANNDRENIGLGNRSEADLVQAVSGNFFQGLRISPLLGRAFAGSDDTAAAAPVAMVSYNFWRGKLAGDASALGKTITVNGTPVTIIGVIPPSFLGLEPGNAPDVWITLSLYAQQYAAQSISYDDNYLQSPKTFWLGVVGRLKPHVTTAQANAEVQLLCDQALGIGTAALPRDEKVPTWDTRPLAHGLDDTRQAFTATLWILMGMVGLVLLIACANVAGLLLARSTARQREIAVRLSLGAPRLRIVRQLLTESLLLAIAGGVAGLFLAYWLSAAMIALLSSGRSSIVLDARPDLSVMAFTALIATFCGILFGLVPALRATRVEVYPTLKQTSSTATRGGHQFLSGKVLVGGQVALSLLLLIAAGLMLRTLNRLERVHLGFDADNLVTFRVQPGFNGYHGERLTAYYDELQRRIRALPGVRSVAVSQIGPVGSGASSGSVEIVGYTTKDHPTDAYRHFVGGGYFDTLGIPVVFGRTITDADAAGAPRVAMVNQRFVHQLMHDDNPIGHIIKRGAPGGKVLMYTIVGVTADVKYRSIRGDIPPTVYFPYLQAPYEMIRMTFLVRTAGEPKSVMAGIEREALGADPAVPVLDLRTENELINRTLYLERVFALLSSAFGGLALLLACVGLYGTIGYTVARRTNEIGIRMALGAERVMILKMILRETLAIVAVGVAVGFPLVWFATRILKAQLYELSPHDPATIASAIAAIVAVTLIAGFLPARRASRVDPMVALRYE